MTGAAASPRDGAAAWRDVLALVKPGITAMSMFVAAGALALAPGHAPLALVITALVGIAAIVGAANALNQFVERETDALMERTRLRPLPDQRLSPRTALVFGLALGVVSLVVLGFGVNLLTAGLGFGALVLYVLVYTPMKRRTPAALVVGAVPGAMPVLMGWTAATGHVDPAGVALFLILFVWQIPHFIAISVYRQAEYDKAGLLVVPTVRGPMAARRETLAYTAALLPISLALVPLGLGGWTFAAVALGAGGWLVALSLAGRASGGALWARKYFLATLAYLPALGVGLAIDGILR